MLVRTSVYTVTLTEPAASVVVSVHVVVNVVVSVSVHVEDASVV